jgi:DNA-binding response OmpR family regulator
MLSYSMSQSTLQPRILVVEDESFVRALIVDALTEAGFDVHEASNSNEAVKLLDEDDYLLLVTDMQIPGRFTGAELAERGKSRNAPIPVLFVHGRAEAMRGLTKSGIKGAVLPQPFALDELVEIARSLTREAPSDS